MFQKSGALTRASRRLSSSSGRASSKIAPEIGGPLELRIRGARGLASSCIRELRSPAPGCLLVGTERSVYLVALPELNAAPHAPAVEREAVAMLKDFRVEASADSAFTQYVRLSLDGEAGPSALPRGPVFASVESAASGDKQALGQCELLSLVLPGSPLRLATAEGRVLATSDVVSVTRSEAGEFCIATGNSLYVLAPIAPLEPAA